MKGPGGTSAVAPARRTVLTALLAAPVAGCAFPARTASPTSSGQGAGPSGGGRVTASGRIVVKDTALAVVDAATGAAKVFPAAETSHSPGVGVCRKGVLGDVWDWFGAGSDSWHVTVRDLGGRQLADYTVGGPLAFPTSAATIDPDATRIAFSVDEPRTADGDAERIDRVYVHDLRTGEVLARIDERSEPLPVAGGELFVRAGDALHVYDASFADGGPVGLGVSPRAGAYDVSPDGRYVVAEVDFRLQGLDRTTGRTWQVTDEFARSHFSPAFSPDGTRLALLRAGQVASQYLTVVPFEPGRTHRVTDADEVRSPAGDFYGGTGRIGWAV